MKRLFTQPNAQRVSVAAIAIAGLTGLAGCQSVSDMLASDRVNYHVTSAAPTLQVPPDLTQQKFDQRFVAPPAQAQLGNGPTRVATAQGTYTLGTPTQTDPLGMHVEREGDRRWLVVDGRSPDDLWPELQAFWQKQGFAVVTDSPSTGIMETDWTENRAKIGDDWFRRLLGKFASNVYSSGTRDRFRTVVGRGANGSTDIFITHSGMEETLIGQDQDSSRWQAVPRNPALEAAFIQRLAQTLGLSEAQSAQLMAQAREPADQARLVQNGGESTIDLPEPFDRAWLRVGLALDRAAFTVDNSDRDKGLYYVRQVNPAKDVERTNGLFSKLFGGKNANPDGPRYTVNVRPMGNAATQVAVTDANGQLDTSRSAQQLLNALHAQLN